MQDSEIIEVWKKVVEVQKHFNDICIKIRALAITIISAFIATVGYGLIKEEAQISDLQLLSALALLAWIAFYIMDVKWYHVLLLGAVKHGIENIEEKYLNQIPEIGLAKRIREEAHNSIFGRCSDIKLHFFYFIGAIIIAFPWIYSLISKVSACFH